MNEQTLAEELLNIQKPLAMSVETLMSMLNYFKNTLPEDIFKPLVESLKQNINNSLDSLLNPIDLQGLKDNLRSNGMDSLINSMAGDSDVVSCHSSGASNIMLDADGKIRQI